MEWKLYVTTRTGQRIALLSDAEIEQVKWSLNGPGDMGFSIDPLHPAAAALLLGKVEVQLWLRDPDSDPVLPNTLAWWGFPIRVEGDQDGIRFDCEGLLAYFKYRIIDTASQLFTSVEQFDIVADLVQWVQTGTDRDLNIEIAAYVPSGKERSRDYSRWEHQTILEIMEEFPTLNEGFDYDIKLYGDGRREWTPYYPKKGVHRDNLSLVWGRNLKKYTYREDAASLANQVYVAGGSAGEVKFEQNWTDVAARAEYGLFQDVVSEGQQKDIGWLLDKAKQEVADRKQPIITPELSAVQLPVRYLGTIETGDTFPVIIDHGRVQVNGNYRIDEINWSPREEDIKIGVEAA